MFWFLGIIWITSLVPCYGYYQGNFSTLLKSHLDISTDMPMTNDDELIITGVFNGPRYNHQPQVVEVYAVKEIPDLSIYTLEFGGSSGPDFTFPQEHLSEGSFTHITQDANGYKAYFEKEIMGGEGNFNETAVVSGTNIITLHKDGEAVDVYGGGSGDRSIESDWSFTDGWAYRKDCTRASDTFDIEDWDVMPGISHTGEEYATVETTSDPFPEMSYQP